MAKTKDLIKNLLEKDPTGEMEVLVLHEGYAYSLSDYMEKSKVDAGIVDEDGAEDDANCLVINTLF